MQDMAGQGRKVFTRGTLSSTDVNGYLMDQVVFLFATAQERDAELPAPWEGAQCYVAGTVKKRQCYTGGAWRNIPRAVASGTFTVNTSAGGDVLITHGLPEVPTWADVSLIGAANDAIYGKPVLSALQSPNLSVRVYDTRTGTVLGGFPVNIMWRAELV
jgi:hypothetical protein